MGECDSFSQQETRRSSSEVNLSRVPSKHTGSVDSSANPQQINASVLRLGLGFQCQIEFQTFNTLWTHGMGPLNSEPSCPSV